MTQEDYVSFEIAKLLEEKGFEQHKCRNSYDSKGVFKWSDNLDPYEYSAPTLQMTMRWLREEHQLHVDIGYDDLDWSWNIISISEAVPLSRRPQLVEEGTACYRTYEEAVEAAIKYCLKNLI